MPSRKIRRSLSSLAAVAALGVSSTALQHGRSNQRQLYQNVKLGVLTSSLTILEQETKQFLESSNSITEFPLQPPPPQLIEEDIQVKESPNASDDVSSVHIEQIQLKKKQNNSKGITKLKMTKPARSLHSSTKSAKRSQILPPRSKGNRVATMPGFRIETAKSEAKKSSLKYIASVTGRDVSNALKRSRRGGGQKMYQDALSVPDSMVQFADELHQERRITPREEVELGNRTQEAIRLQSLYDDLALSLCREPTDEEWCAAAGKINIEALQQVLKEGLEAKNQLVTSNLRMVQRVVNVYIQNGLGGQYNAGDMMQDGIMALIRAAEKFEPDRGFRFSTYAMYWIRSSVKRSQEFQSRVIPLPQRLHANHKRVVNTRRELQEVLGRQPTQLELAEAVDMTSAQLTRCIKAMDQRFYSLDQQIHNSKKPKKANERENTLYDIIESSDNECEHDSVSRKLLRENLIESLYQHLDRDCAHILLLRFGFVDSSILPQGFEGPLTIAQVSQLVGMKPDKVRRRIIKSLKDLKYLLGREWLDYERILN